MEKIGVVTVLFNSAKVIMPFIECVISQQHTKFNIYIIDNNSQDNSLEIISNFTDSRIRLIRNDSNIGVAAANNIGIKNAFKDNCSKILFGLILSFPRVLCITVLSPSGIIGYILGL